MIARANDAMARLHVESDDVMHLHVILRARGEDDESRRADEDAWRGGDDGVWRETDNLLARATILER